MTIPGGMQHWPLLVTSILDHAATVHARREVVSRMVDGSLHRYSYADLRQRVRRCAGALSALGVKSGQRVGTLAWNTHRHLELWYACAAIGAVCHTVNPRLFEEQISWIVDDAEDVLLFVDQTFVPIAERLVGKCRSVRGVVLLCDRPGMPDTSLSDALCYEELLAAADPLPAWQPLDESAAVGLCYTSGTTGKPKGVLYSHRSMVLLAMSVNGGDAFGLRSVSTVMPVVPMYHANAWSLPFSAPMAGAKLVLPGPRLDGAGLQELANAEGVTFMAGVPTVWTGLLDHLRATSGTLSTVERVVVGGSACPRSMLEAFERELGIEAVHAWGMTEMSPVGSVAGMRAGMESLDAEARYQLRLKQGAPLFGVEMRIADEAGHELPRDGRHFGHLQVRGAAVLRNYFKSAGGEVLDADGYFDTGDIATLDPYSFMQITDRAKDMIKSGGEWISSIELENAAVGHPQVSEAAAVAIPHARWGERPLLFVVRTPDAQLDGAALLAYLAERVVRWAVPDEVRLVEALPHTATGKIDKVKLRSWAVPASVSQQQC